MNAHPLRNATGLPTFVDHAFNHELPSQYYGNQPSRQQWEAGDTSTQMLAESWANPEFLWRLSAFGENVQFELLFGTRGQYTIAGLLAPLRAHLAGKFALQARPVNPALPAWALGNYTVATGGIDCVRGVVAFVAVPIPLSPLTRHVTALTAVTLTVNGTAVPLAQGASLDVAGPVVLTGGTVIADYAV